MKRDNTIDAFLALVRAGLWEKDVNLSVFEKIDYAKLYQLAEEQSVLGLVAAGLEHLKDIRPPKEDVLQFVGQTLQLEQQNTAMNYFIGVLVEKMRTAGIYTLLVKGQSVAQYYERPLWRACGDADFYLSEDNFQKAKAFFRPLVESFDPDNDYAKHINMHYDSQVIEIHSDQHTNLSCRIDKELDKINYDLFYNGNIRSCMFGKTQVFLPSIESDILIVFTHLIKHFYKGGLGIRQICDWSRLLWKFHEKTDLITLENRLEKMGLRSEWKAFGAFAVDYLGMPSEAMPFYSENKKWKRKADKICTFVMKIGNFGHNRDMSYYESKPYLIRKMISLGRRIRDSYSHARIFPLDSIRFLPNIVFNGVRSAIRGE